MSTVLDASERVVLVDEGDSEIGVGRKLETHHQGALHRAFSIFLFDPQGRTLVQKRAAHKYHSGGKWANTCCGHPRPGEDILAAISFIDSNHWFKRLGKRQSIVCNLSCIGSFL